MEGGAGREGIREVAESGDGVEGVRRRQHWLVSVCLFCILRSKMFYLISFIFVASRFGISWERSR